MSMFKKTSDSPYIDLTPMKTEFRCVVCEEPMTAYEGGFDIHFDGGTPIRDSARYGSKFDTDKIEMAICDDCLTKKAKADIISIKEMDYSQTQASGLKNEKFKSQSISGKKS